MTAETSNSGQATTLAEQLKEAGYAVTRRKDEGCGNYRLSARYPDTGRVILARYRDWRLSSLTVRQWRWMVSVERIGRAPDGHAVIELHVRRGAWGLADIALRLFDETAYVEFVPQPCPSADLEMAWRKALDSVRRRHIEEAWHQVVSDYLSGAAAPEAERVADVLRWRLHNWLVDTIVAHSLGVATW